MGYTVTFKKKLSVPLLDEGTYPAICVGYVTLGDQFIKKYNKTSERIILIFEVCNEFVDIDGEKQPRWMSKTYSVSSGSKAALTNDIKAWMGISVSPGETFDFGLTVKRPCMVQVLAGESSAGDPTRYVGAVMAPVKGMVFPNLISDPIEFDHITNYAHAVEIYDTLPQWMRDLVAQSSAWMEHNANSEAVDVEPPFAQADPPDRPRVQRSF